MAPAVSAPDKEQASEECNLRDRIAVTVESRYERSGL